MLLHYKELGKGQPLIILHGLFGSSDNWQTHAKKFSSYFRVILIDQRNHGHSEWAEEFNYAILANDLEKLINHLSIETFYLLGHSMGGKTAMYYSQKFTHRVTKLIIVDIGIKKYPMHHQQIIEGINSLRLNLYKTRSEVEHVLLPYIDSFGTRQFILKNLYWKEKGKLAWRMNVKVLEQQMEEILREIPYQEVWTQSLFIRGDQSNYILNEDWEEIERYFPDSNLVTIQNAGHWVHAEQIAEFSQKVIEFLIR